MHLAPGYTAPIAASVKRAVGKPVIVTGWINQPQIAEVILAGGQADLCGMMRAMISDPEMPAKALAERTDDIRACIGCDQACIGRLGLDEGARHRGGSISDVCGYPGSQATLRLATLCGLTLRPSNERRLLVRPERK